MSNPNLAFPQFAGWISDYCKTHEDPFIRNSPEMIASCRELAEKLPEKYGWRFSDVESLTKQISKARTSKAINIVYWLDQARNIEAYSVMTFWRGLELMEPAIRSLNVHEIITPAVLVRSLLELSCVFLVNSNNLDASFGALRFPDEAVVASPELEEMVVKMIWGTRVGDPPGHLKQTNILTYIQKVSKNPKAKDLLPFYEYLCDVAHPNFIGNTRFWSHIEKVYPDGSQQRVIAKHAYGECTSEIMDKIVWGLGWSSAALANAFAVTKEAIQQLLTKLKES